MTTRIHIVNFGPNAVTVEANGNVKANLYVQQSCDEYVFDGQELTIKELKYKPEDSAQ